MIARIRRAIRIYLARLAVENNENTCVEMYGERFALEIEIAEMEKRGREAEKTLKLLIGEK